ncbi:hypothetical protein ACKC9G_16755 [Pokkaliibacter sp. CJK22405]|uniref:hypothetical protein n=1 Tax=Pokkaliibacter sp. CJK22405 TaxID=3384615 RepID=UPI003984FCFC
MHDSSLPAVHLKTLHFQLGNLKKFPITGDFAREAESSQIPFGRKSYQLCKSLTSSSAEQTARLKDLLKPLIEIANEICESNIPVFALLPATSPQRLTEGLRPFTDQEFILNYSRLHVYQQGNCAFAAAGKRLKDYLDKGQKVLVIAADSPQPKGNRPVDFSQHYCEGSLAVLFEPSTTGLRYITSHLEYQHDSQIEVSAHSLLCEKAFNSISENTSRRSLVYAANSIGTDDEEKGQLIHSAWSNQADLPEMILPFKTLGELGCMEGLVKLLWQQQQNLQNRLLKNALLINSESFSSWRAVQVWEYLEDTTAATSHMTNSGNDHG